MTDDVRLGPDDLVGHHFPVALRGYDRHAVDEFLVRAATSWRSALAGPATVAPAPSETATNGPSAPVTFDESAEPVGAAGETATENSVTTVDTTPESGVPGTSLNGDHADTAIAVEEGTGAADDELEGPSADTPPEGATEANGVSALDDSVTRAEMTRDRTAAFAERKAAELDRATARIELARAQEEALRIVDGAQRRAESVLIGTRDRARVAAESVLAEARARLGPLLEQERTTRVSLTRLSHDIGVVAAAGTGGEPPTLPAAADLVVETENDPDTPPPPFPIDIDASEPTDD